MYEKEFSRILDASQNNALTFFVGAGVSALSGAPTWKGLIHAINDKLGRTRKDEYSSDEYLQIPQMYFYSLEGNTEEYYRFIKEQLHSSDLAINQIHREMLNLNPASFITTNYDTLIEDAAVQYCQSYKVVSRDEDVPTIFGDKFILKLHGDFKNNNFVLKEEDYLNYSENFKLTETLVKSIFSTNTVVFIGYGLNDYNIKLILNWTKALLKDSFREPIFLYTGDRTLSKEELIYQTSKGISVIEWTKLTASAEDFLSRYQAFFSVLNNHSKLSLEGKSDDEAFEILYNMLKPLARLNALRIGDVSKKLFPYVRISDEGEIINLHKDNRILNKFYEINQLSEAQKNSIPKEDLKKYQCIIDVFKKARIVRVQDEHKYRRFIFDDVPFADANCILFAYTEMQAFSSKKYSSLENNYKKAFYLSRLLRYDEAFFLLSEVAKQAFKDRNYLLYYLAESNCLVLRKIIKNSNTWYHKYDINSVEALSPNDIEAENLFRRLPVEFRNAYNNLKDIHNSANLLYTYSYEAFIDGQKLQKAVDAGTIEFGLSSSEKAFCRINEYLHFLLGNGIVADVFSEYRNSVKNLMSQLVYKFSTQGKTILHEQPFPDFGENEIEFDEIDFYCFIRFFDDKEIVNLFKKFGIDTITFNHMELVENAVCNMLDFYRDVVQFSTVYDKRHFQQEIKNCLALLRFVDISQKLVDKICLFILPQEFGEIYINDKVTFLIYQLDRRKKYSETTACIVENTLIKYIDCQISAIKNHEDFGMFSTNSNIHYYDLVHLISPHEKEYSSRKLSIRVSQIINSNLAPMYPQIIHHYYKFVSKSQQHRIIAWVNKQLQDSFDFEFFTMLILCDARITAKTITQLKAFLRKKIDATKKEQSNAIIVSPRPQPHRELNQVGYWCLLHSLKAGDFKEFLGNSNVFDFYCEYNRFDFTKFDVAWLLRIYPHALDQIAKDETVKSNIRSAIAIVLKEKNILTSDYQKLQEILIRHFC